MGTRRDGLWGRLATPELISSWWSATRSKTAARTASSFRGWRTFRMSGTRSCGVREGS